jgi:hypothetical protein
VRYALASLVIASARLIGADATHAPVVPAVRSTYDHVASLPCWVDIWLVAAGVPAAPLLNMTPVPATPPVVPSALTVQSESTYYR